MTSCALKLDLHLKVRSTTCNETTQGPKARDPRANPLGRVWVVRVLSQVSHFHKHTHA